MAEAALFVSRWTAAKSGAAASLWTAMPRRVNRYLEEMVSAHSQSLEHEDGKDSALPTRAHHFTMGGRLIK